MADRRRPFAHGCGKLLDVATQPRHQPKPGCLASGASGLGALGLFCPRERSRVPLYAARDARGRHWHIESPAKRGRQRRGVAVPDLPRAARSVSRPAAWRVSRSLQCGRQFLPGEGSSVLPSANGDPAASRQLAVQQLDNLRQQQASSLAYFDTFWMAAALTLVVAFAVLFMKRSVAEKAGHAGPE